MRGTIIKPLNLDHKMTRSQGTEAYRIHFLCNKFPQRFFVTVSYEKVYLEESDKS